MSTAVISENVEVEPKGFNLPLKDNHPGNQKNDANVKRGSAIKPKLTPVRKVGSSVDKNIPKFQERRSTSPQPIKNSSMRPRSIAPTDLSKKEQSRKSVTPDKPKAKPVIKKPAVIQPTNNNQLKVF